MDISRRALGAGLLLAATGARAQTPAPTPAPTPTPAAPWKVPDDAAIRRMLVQRVDVEKQSVGIVVGVIDASGRRIVSYGAMGKGDPRPLDGDSVFEIGSITKVFTSLLLSDMVARGQVKLDDPVVKYLPPGAKVPERGGKQITLIDLATHSSGLPRMPTNFKPKDPLNPFADYTEAQLYEFLAGYALPRDIGARYEYSNVAVGLLGQALSRRAGQDFETLVRTRITAPLGMKDTAVTLTPRLKAHLATGHIATLEPTPNWDLPTLAGAGALRSTTNDMLTFLAAELGFKPTPLKAAMDAQLVPRRPGPPNTDVALAWHIAKYATGEVPWHNGGTGGYRTFAGFDPKARVGVVVLTNAASTAGGDDIGFHLLAGRPLMTFKPPPPPRTAIALPPAELAGLVGRYQFGAAPAYLTVTLDGARLMAALTGQSAYEIFPESRTEFFWRVVDAQVTFERGPDGRAGALVLHQLGRNQRATRSDP